MKKTLVLAFCLLGLFACGNGGSLSSSEIAELKALPLEPYGNLDTAKKAIAKKLMVKALEANITNDLATAICTDDPDKSCLDKNKAKINKFKEILKDSQRFEASFKNLRPLYIVAAAVDLKKLVDLTIAKKSKSIDPYERKKIIEVTLKDYGIKDESRSDYQNDDDELWRLIQE